MADTPEASTPLTPKSFTYWSENLADGRIWATWNQAWEFIERGLIEPERLDPRPSPTGRSSQYLYKATGREPVAPESGEGSEGAWAKPERRSPIP